MGLARDLWRLVSRRNAPNVQSMINRPVVSGVPITPDSALTVAAAFAAINVIATDAACLPLRVVRSLPDGTVEPVSDPRNELIDVSPDDGETTAMRQRQALMGHVLTWGNGYLRVRRDLGTGLPIRLEKLDPQPWKTKPRRHETGRLVYDLEDGRETVLGENVIHVAGLGWDGLSGYSPVALMREAIGLAKAAELFGAAFFGNGSKPSGFIKVKGEMDPEAAANLRESIERMHQGPDKAWRLAVLEEGAEWQSVTMPLEDAQFLASRKFQIREIAAIYRVPPSKLADYDNAHHSSVEESNADYTTSCLRGWLVAKEQAYNLKLFTAAERASGLRVQHDMTALLRGNMLARAQFYRELFGIGGISPNEVARRENLPATEGGDQRFVPLNLVPIQHAGRPDPKTTLRDAS